MQNILKCGDCGNFCPFLRYGIKTSKGICLLAKRLGEVKVTLAETICLYSKEGKNEQPQQK